MFCRAYFVRGVDRLIYVGVDVGRSSCKVAYTAGDPQKAAYFEVLSLVATSFNGFSRHDGALVNSFADADISQIEVKETQGSWNKGFADFFMFGKQAQKQGGSVSAFSEGSQFHKFGVAMILYTVARVVDVLRDDKVSLAINFTYSNNDAVSFYSGALKGRHKVSLGKAKGVRLVGEDVVFTISDLYCFQQGYASVFNFIGTKEFGLIQSGRGVVVDIGRYTVDLSRVEDLTLVDGRSINYGTRHLISELQSMIAVFGLKLSAEEIERSFVEHDVSYSNAEGKVVKPWSSLANGDLLDRYYAEIKVALSSFVGEERFDYMILCGGGSYLVRSRLERDFRLKTLVLDYLRANVSGMLRMMTV